MVHFDSYSRTLHGDDDVPIYNPKVSLGNIILHHLKKYPENVFQVNADDGTEITCGKMANLMTNFAKNMLKKGFKEGDVVGIIGNQSNYITSAILGCFIAALPISTIFMNRDDYSMVFDLTDPKIIFCDGTILNDIKLFADSKSIKVVTLTEKIEGFHHISEFFVDADDITM
jgi:4-coumarate--CoA ligase